MVNRKALVVVGVLSGLLLVGIGSWVVFGRLLEQKSLEQQQTVVDSHARAIDAYQTSVLKNSEVDFSFTSSMPVTVPTLREYCLSVGLFQCS